MTHRKVEDLTNYYMNGYMTEHEYWRLKFDITTPEMGVMRTVLCKPLGLLAHYLGEFSIYACYHKYMEGKNIEFFRKEAVMTQRKRLLAKRAGQMRRKHSEYLVKMKG